jgi:hypothetical protein
LKKEIVMSAGTQKFIFAMLMLVGGVVLCIATTPYGDQGPWLISFAAGAVFGVAKKPGSAAKLLLLSALLCVGCVGPQLDPGFVSLTNKIFDRHDAYVTEDTTLQQLEEEAYLEETSACREYLNAVQTKKEDTSYP